MSGRLARKFIRSGLPSMLSTGTRCSRACHGLPGVGHQRSKRSLWGGHPTTCRTRHALGACSTQHHRLVYTFVRCSSLHSRERLFTQHTGLGKVAFVGSTVSQDEQQRAGSAIWHLAKSMKVCSSIKDVARCANLGKYMEASCRELTSPSPCLTGKEHAACQRI